MEVVLVDKYDKPKGIMGKMEVHRKGILHRAFSIFIFNDKGEMVLQKRAAQKYHSANLWTNTCCGHPKLGEDILQAAQKRLQEEMGFTTSLTKIFDFIYKASFGNGLKEYEFDHVYIGNHEGNIFPDPKEVSDYCYKSTEEIKKSLQTHPQNYTVWFKFAFQKLVDYL